ncbi:NAD-dependent epimerase/dehydratase family protein, partial [Streptococcus pneumoniae]|nr:NAD-dependent epimerase/dehydratase family protein [Streptococcus pneumoniae]
MAHWIVANKPEYRIVGIDNLSSGFRENVPPEVEFVGGTVSHAAAYHPSIFVEPFDAVFHFAAFAAECLSPFVRRYTIRNVWEPTADLLNA